MFNKVTTRRHDKASDGSVCTGVHQRATRIEQVGETLKLFQSYHPAWHVTRVGVCHMTMITIN